MTLRKRLVRMEEATVNARPATPIYDFTVLASDLLERIVASADNLKSLSDDDEASLMAAKLKPEGIAK